MLVIKAKYKKRTVYKMNHSVHSQPVLEPEQKKRKIDQLVNGKGIVFE